MKKFAQFASAVVFSGMVASPLALAEATGELQVGVNILSEISIESATAMQFGDVGLPNGAGAEVVLTMATDGQVSTTTAGVDLSGSVSRGAFTISSNTPLTVNAIADVELTGPAGSENMQLTDIQLLNADDSAITGSFVPGSQGTQFPVIGNLKMKDNQAGGAYTGTVIVTVDAG